MAIDSELAELLEHYTKQGILLVALSFLAWQKALRVGALPNVRFRIKLGHALFFVFIARLCWNWTMVGYYIARFPGYWMQYLSEEKRFYPVWLDLVFQISEAVIGPLGLICSYMLLKRSVSIRRKFVWLVLILYVCCTYDFVRAYRDYSPLVTVVFTAAGVLAFPFVVITLFYRTPTVESLLFSGTADNRPQERMTDGCERV